MSRTSLQGNAVNDVLARDEVAYVQIAEIMILLVNRY